MKTSPDGQLPRVPRAVAAAVERADHAARDLRLLMAAPVPPAREIPPMPWRESAPAGPLTIRSTRSGRAAVLRGAHARAGKARSRRARRAHHAEFTPAERAALAAVVRDDRAARERALVAPVVMGAMD